MGIDWDFVRDTEFPVARRWAYLDHAAQAALPKRSADVLRAWTDAQERDGGVGWPEQAQRLEAVRGQAARLINAHPDEIAFIQSTTQGIGLVAEGFPFRAGDTVVTAADEFPANLVPWLNLESRGVSVRQVESRDGRIWPEDLAAAIDASTRVLAISHVEFATGFRNDLAMLAELCHARGVALFVDAIQGLGALPIDVRTTPVDFLAASGQKWLLGPEGAGLLYVSRHWIERLRPIGIGCNSFVGSHDDPIGTRTLKQNAARWEGGCVNMAGLHAFGASVGLFLELGPAEVSRRVLERASAVRDAAERAGFRVYGSPRAADRSGIVILERAGIDHYEAAQSLRQQGIVVSCRRGRLRVSPHFYNNDDDIERLRRGLAAIA